MKNKDIELICQIKKNWHPENTKIEKAGGQTNRNWIVQYKKKKFFVRLPWQGADILDREIEAKNVLALTRCKQLAEILPKYYLYIFKKKNILSPKSNEKFNLPDGTQVLEYIKGKDIDGKDLEKPKIQEALVRTLHLFHTSGIKFVNVYDVFRDEMTKYKNKAKEYPLNKLVSREELDDIEEVEKIMRQKLTPGGRISTHNDLIFENLRLGKNGKIYLLDFEYAGFNVRDGLYYDLGIILGGNLFQKKPIQIETYNEILRKAEKFYGKKINFHKVYYGALTNILIMFWWGMVKYFTSFTKEEKNYFRNYVLKRAKGIKSLYDKLTPSNNFAKGEITARPGEIASGTISLGKRYLTGSNK